jgi:hypothetical protein
MVDRVIRAGAAARQRISEGDREKTDARHQLVTIAHTRGEVR